MSEFNACLRSGKVSFGDDLCSVAEVTHLFRVKATKLPYHNWFTVPGKENTIACLLSENGGDGWQNARKIGPMCDKRGWNEILVIEEFNKDSEKTAARIADELARPLTRYVFWREERAGATWYKSYGIFTVDADSTRATLGTDNPRVVYRRISKTAECLKVEEVKTAFSDGEFKALAGKTVEFDFLDDLAVVAEGKDKTPGGVSAMPGDKFFVKEATSQFLHVAACSAEGEGILLAVPRRDFELGYARVLP